MSWPSKQGRRKWRSRKAKARERKRALVQRFHKLRQRWWQSPPGFLQDTYFVLWRACAFRLAEKYPDEYRVAPDAIYYPVDLIVRHPRHSAVIMNGER